MLYSNGLDRSIAYGDIEYVTEHLRDYITNGKPDELHIRPTESNVMKVLREYNGKNDFSLDLFRQLK